ncbi:hypothetical protein EWM64_g3658 [Hericium alpestre]|uniref:Uncharacterized protein n=1 Tax=Hericium alpestre TaxID=135208 RepID=A0A4Z0A2A3_9AGAM|nr:hypothetical protein EWM64_g3658 [Hericium alpestre]
MADICSVFSVMDVDNDEDRPSAALSEQVLGNPDILDIILAFASPATIIRLSWTCRHLLASKDAYFRRAYNVNRHLSRFFADPLAFRALQARTSTLVSGSSALQFLDRSYYAGSDLDTYVPYAHTRDVAHWLQSAGYAYESANEVQAADLEAAVVQMERESGGDKSIYNMRGVTGVFNFYKRANNVVNDARLKVQIIVALHCPMEIVLNFHCSTSIYFIR